MQPQVYGSPQNGNRPSCWGRPDIYDTDDRECRGCGFQSSCRAQVIKLTPTQQTTQPVQTQSPYPYSYAPFSSPQAAPVPAPVAMTQYRPPVSAMPAPIAPPTYTSPVKVAAPAPQHQPQQLLQQDWYGRMQDPLFFTVLSPPPFRPQMPGENFGERLLKNLMLDLAAMAFGHLMLGLRQMVLPPLPGNPPDHK